MRTVGPEEVPSVARPGIGAGLLEAVRGRLAEAGAEPTPARVAMALRAEGRLLGDAEVLGVVSALRSEMIGSGPLEPLITHRM